MKGPLPYGHFCESSTVRPDLVWLALGVVLSSCSGSPTSAKPSGPVTGWHDAGLALSRADQSAGGVQWLSTVGNRIIASTASGEVFLGQQGSLNWDTLHLPGGDSSYGQSTMDSFVYFGTKTPGHAWQLEFPSMKWTNLGIPTSGSVYVDFLIPWSGALAAETFDVNTAKVHVYSGGPTWTDYSGGWPASGTEATAAFAVGANLFATTYSSGLWRRGSTDTAWSRLPDPVVPILQANGQYSPGTLDKPRSLAWYHGNLWVGYLIWSQIVHATGTDTPWVVSRLDTTAFPGHTLPGDVFALFVWNDRLFAAGQNPEVPLVYNETSGWRYITQNWGKSDDGTQTTCGVGISLAFASIGDTLYVAGCGHIFKLPASQVPQ